MGLHIVRILLCAAVVFGSDVYAQALSTPTSVNSWGASGKTPEYYRMGTTTSQHHSGNSAAFIRAVDPHSGDWATLMQMADAGQYKGKRLEMTGWVKADSVSGWSGMWLRIDGENTHDLAFDNMQDRPIKGTSDWTKCTITLDLPLNAKYLAYGLLLEGKGTVYFDDVSFREVGDAITVLPTPQNLNFESH